MTWNASAFEVLWRRRGGSENARRTTIVKATTRRIGRIHAVLLLSHTHVHRLSAPRYSRLSSPVVSSDAAVTTAGWVAITAEVVCCDEGSLSGGGGAMGMRLPVMCCIRCSFLFRDCDTK